MDRIKIEVIDTMLFENMIIAARNCYASKGDDLGEKDLALLKKLWKKGHYSIFEHYLLTAKIEGISRACLQQLVRHRTFKFAVQSTRYTTKKLLKDIDFEKADMLDLVKKFFVIPEKYKNDYDYHLYFLRVLKFLKEKQEQGMKNDELKYFLPEAWRTNVVLTVDLRNFANFLKQRLDKHAHFEIRHLAKMFVEQMNPLLREIIGF